MAQGIVIALDQVRGKELTRFDPRRTARFDLDFRFAGARTNERDESYFDVYEIDIRKRDYEKTLLYQNDLGLDGNPYLCLPKYPL